MYEKFYGLKEKPFHIVPNPNYFFPSSKHENALTYIEYGLIEEVGFILLTGEIGTGKTTLIRYLLNQIESEIDVAVIFNTKVSSDDLLSLILQEFELELDKSDTKAKKLDIFYRFLIDQYANSRRVLLVIDEAQNLSNEALEEIRMLSNLQTDNRFLLQIMLVGQPQLRYRLNEPDLYQFSQRIVANYHLTAISRAETTKYITYRLEKAGGRPTLFEEEAINLIYQYSSGIPRIINLLCDTALVYGFADEIESINGGIIKKIIDEEVIMGLQLGSIDDAPSLIATPTIEVRVPLERVQTLESRVQALQSDIEQLMLNRKKQTEGHKDESISSLKKFLFKERERNAKLLVEKAHLKSEYESLRRADNKKNSVNGKIDAKLVKKPIGEYMWSPSSISAKSLPIWENHLPEREIGKSRSWFNLTLGLTVGVCLIIIVFLFYGNFDPSFEKVKSFGDMVTGKIQNILTNKPVVEDKPAQDNVTPEEIISPGKGDHLSEIIKPANKESNQDRLDNAVANETEMTTAKIWQSLDQMPITGSQEIADDKPRPLSPSTAQRMLNTALREWGGVVFVRKGEDIFSLVSRVYGGYHPRLLDAVLKENQELKTNSITEGQAVNLPKSYKP